MFCFYLYIVFIIDLVFIIYGVIGVLINIDIVDKVNVLVLFVFDYEFIGVDVCIVVYKQVCFDFEQILLFELLVGLNLGKQLFWL